MDSYEQKKTTTQNREDDTDIVLNAHVVTRDLMGNRGVKEHVVKRHPFVWPANFSLLAQGLQSQGREHLLLRGEATT